jgi:hypothetical protein
MRKTEILEQPLKGKNDIRLTTSEGPQSEQ